MIVELVILAGLAIGGRGPAWHEWRAHRKLKRDYQARVHFVMPSDCRPPGYK